MSADTDQIGMHLYDAMLDAGRPGCRRNGRELKRKPVTHTGTITTTTTAGTQPPSGEREQPWPRL
jgi:hypothetical protein